jgi:peptidoglycan hydrolase CwlO-like protein
MTDYLTLAITLSGALGGIEFLKMFFNWKTNKQKETLHVADANLDVLNKQTDMMQERINYLDTTLKERNEKVDAVYKELRESQAECITLMSEISDLKVQLERATYWKCLVCKCKKRLPPQWEVQQGTEAADGEEAVQ